MKTIDYHLKNHVSGIHHITAVAGDADRNYDFYTHVLGLRFIKKTVDFDDPCVYHLYFGDAVGSPGTILTFFSLGKNAKRGERGVGMVTEIGFSVPLGSLGFWQDRFNKYRIFHNHPASRFGEKYLTFLDPDGLKIELVETTGTCNMNKVWITDDVSEEVAIGGFHHITIMVTEYRPTANVLTDIFGYRLADKEANRYRYRLDGSENGSIIDILEVQSEKQGVVSRGTIHHVAFRVKNEETALQYREMIAGLGFSITSMMDRKYFHSLYFREPNSVLFEMATDNPGFMVDESFEQLGTSLQLPVELEMKREEIEALLPRLKY